jgi:hypothetical protein
MLPVLDSFLSKSLVYLSVLPKSVCLMTFTSFNPQIILLGFRYTTFETDYSKYVPVVIGTNILKPIKSSVSDSHVKVPHNWDIAFSALDAGVNLVKSTNKRPIKVGRWHIYLFYLNQYVS